MNTQKVIYLLEVLRSATKGHEEELNKLYGEALEADESVQSLKRCLRDYNFYQGRGQSLHEKGVSLLNRLYEKPAEALETFQDIERTKALIDQEVRLSRELLRSPEPFLDPITILPEKEILDYLTVYKKTAASCVYLMALYGGMSALAGLHWNEAAGLLETVHLVNTRFLPALSRTKRPSRSWMIWKKPLGKNALFFWDGFFITYEAHENVESLCGPLRREPMGTHAFLNGEAFDNNQIQAPYCWGTGNLVSCSPENAMMLLRTGAVTKPRIPSAEELNVRMPSPRECLNRLCDGKAYCISPEELVSVMNQWYVGHEIEKRKSSRSCLFCKRPLNGRRLVCPSHFSTEF